MKNDTTLQLIINTFHSVPHILLFFYMFCSTIGPGKEMWIRKPPLNTSWQMLKTYYRLTSLTVRSLSELNIDRSSSFSPVQHDIYSISTEEDCSVNAVTLHCIMGGVKWMRMMPQIKLLYTWIWSATWLMIVTLLWISSLSLLRVVFQLKSGRSTSILHK